MILVSRTLTILCLCWLIVAAPQATGKVGGIDALERCFDIMTTSESKVSLGHKQIVAGAAVSAIITGIMPVYQETTPLPPSKMSGENIKMTNHSLSDLRMNSVQVFGFSRDEIATDYHRALYTALFDAARLVAIDPSSLITEAIKKLGILREWGDHLAACIALAKGPAPRNYQRFARFSSKLASLSKVSNANDAAAVTVAMRLALRDADRQLKGPHQAEEAGAALNRAQDKVKELICPGQTHWALSEWGPVRLDFKPQNETDSKEKKSPIIVEIHQCAAKSEDQSSFESKGEQFEKQLQGLRQIPFKILQAAIPVLPNVLIQLAQKYTYREIVGAQLISTIPEVSFQEEPNMLKKTYPVATGESFVFEATHDEYTIMLCRPQQEPSLLKRYETLYPEVHSFIRHGPFLPVLAQNCLTYVENGLIERWTTSCQLFSHSEDSICVELVVKLSEEFLLVAPHNQKYATLLHASSLTLPVLLYNFWTQLLYSDSNILLGNTRIGGLGHSIICWRLQDFLERPNLAKELFTMRVPTEPSILENYVTQLIEPYITNISFGKNVSSDIGILLCMYLVLDPIDQTPYLFMGYDDYGKGTVAVVKLIFE